MLDFSFLFFRFRFIVVWVVLYQVEHRLDDPAYCD